MSLNAPSVGTLSASGVRSAVGSYTQTTAAFSPGANALICVLIAANVPVSGHDASVSSVTDSGGLSWSLGVRKNKNAASTGGAGTDGGAEIWTATTPAGFASSITVSVVPNSNATIENSCDLAVFPMWFTDTLGSAPTIGNVAANFSASGTPTVGLTTSAGSYGVASISDWSASTTTGTAGTATTLLFDGHEANYAYHGVRSTATTSAGTTTLVMGVPTTQNYNIAALEVKAATAAGPRPGLPNRRFWRAAHRSANI